MNLPLIFNIGDTVWLWHLGKIISKTIVKVYVTIDGYETIIKYVTSDNDTLMAQDENQFWFRTRQEVVDFINRTVIDPTYEA